LETFSNLIKTSPPIYIPFPNPTLIYPIKKVSEDALWKLFMILLHGNFMI